jgi:signal peptidase complex subunit 2
MATEEKITVHNLADLKNTSDDAVPNYLNSLKFRQDHSLADVRLALGYGAFAVAGACFLWDYKLGFDYTKYWTAAAVAIYALLNAILTYWIAYVERGIIYQGSSPDGGKISISTSTKKNVPIYNMKITTKSKKGDEKTIEAARSFTEWFDAQGRFIALPFQTMLATTVPVIAKADPKRAAAAGTTDSTSDFLSADAATLDALAASSEATGADAGSKKSKRRKA